MLMCKCSASLLGHACHACRYGLEGYVISESNRLTGVWLLARCADLQVGHRSATCVGCSWLPACDLQWTRPEKRRLSLFFAHLLLRRLPLLQGLHYDVRRFGWCLLALFSLGMAARLLAILCMMLLHRDKQR